MRDFKIFKEEKKKKRKKVKFPVPYFLRSHFVLRLHL